MPAPLWEQQIAGMGGLLAVCQREGRATGPRTVVLLLPARGGHARTGAGGLRRMIAANSPATCHLAEDAPR
jgi:hypothetical protein